MRFSDSHITILLELFLGITPHRPNTHTPKTTESTTTKLGSFHLPTSSITKENRGGIVNFIFSLVMLFHDNHNAISPHFFHCVSPYQTDFQTPNSTVGTTTKLGSFHLPTSCITKEKVIGMCQRPSVVVTKIHYSTEIQAIWLIFCTVIFCIPPMLIYCYYHDKWPILIKEQSMKVWMI